jgi:Ni,Fe-hydrogenase I small subunit
MQHMFAQFSMWCSKQQNGCDIALNSINLNLHDQIIFDSGATDHMFCNEELLTNINLIKNIKYVLVANGTKVQIDGIERYNIFFKGNKRYFICKIFFYKFNFY